MILNNCIVCGSTQRIEVDHEVLCTCGAVYGVVDAMQAIPSRTKITSNNQNKIGSKNPVDPKLKLHHINKQRTAHILDKTNRHDAEFLHCCDILNMNHSITDTAFSLFQKLRIHKLGLGKTAVFCIYHACSTFEVLCDADVVISTVRCRFRLKRTFDLSDAIYCIKSKALELNLITNNESLSDSFAIKKYVGPERHVQASKILDCFSGKTHAKAKATESYLRCYS